MGYLLTRVSDSGGERLRRRKGHTHGHIVKGWPLGEHLHVNSSCGFVCWGNLVPNAMFGYHGTSAKDWQIQVILSFEKQKWHMSSLHWFRLIESVILY